MTREISDRELALIERIIAESSSALAAPTRRTVVRPLADGDMGSFSFDLDGSRSYRSTLGEVEFEDVDGVKVLASLYLDADGELYELDIFKADFSPLRSPPM